MAVEGDVVSNVGVNDRDREMHFSGARCKDFGASINYKRIVVHCSMIGLHAHRP